MKRTGKVVFVLAALLSGLALGAVGGTGSRWIGNLLIFDGSSGNDAFRFDVNGLRGRFGSGAEAFWHGNSTHMMAGTSPGAGYIATATPFTIASVYVNGPTPLAATNYGGGVLPAHPFTVQAIRYRIRAAGSGGTTNVVFRTTDGVNNCDCSFACNAAAPANYRTTCSGTCAFASSASLTYSFSSLGDCAVKPDIMGNIEVEGFWQ